jgi:anti-sigma B factor antagonist
MPTDVDRRQFAAGGSMQIQERIVGSVAIVEVSGDIVMNDGDVQLKDKARSLIQQGFRKVVVDLGHVGYMDSAALGALVQAYATTKNAGGAMKLMRVTSKMKDLLTITKLVTVFDTFDNEAEALASFSTGA